jgi:hypothetical protein
VRRLARITLAFLALMLLIVVVAVTSSSAGSSSCAGGGSGPVTGLPSNLLPIYNQAAASYKLGPGGWAYLAAINEVETDFGRNLSTSSAGAEGWMQIMPATWQQYAVSADPTHPGASPDPNDPWDAIFTAARKLHADGAPANWSAAIFAYNHAGWYVAQVQQLAQRYAQNPGVGATATLLSATQSPGCVIAGPTVAGATAQILPTGMAAIPQNAPAAVQAAITAGNQIIDTSYSQERTPKMLTTVMPSYDCSGSTDYVLYNAGLSSPLVDVGNGVAGDSSDLEHYGDPGPGRWISVYATGPHAFIAVGGIVLDTAYYASVQPSTPTSGPRWQPASIIPAQLKDGNTWTVRHPPVL